METSKCTMSFLTLVFGPNWWGGIEEDYSGSGAWEKLVEAFEDDSDFLEAFESMDFWIGWVKLDGIQFVIGSDVDARYGGEGVAFLVAAEGGRE